MCSTSISDVISSWICLHVQLFQYSPNFQVIRRFCDRIPGINELCKPDVDLLFQTACLELFSLRLAYR